MEYRSLGYAQRDISWKFRHNYGFTQGYVTTHKIPKETLENRGYHYDADFRVWVKQGYTFRGIPLSGEAYIELCEKEKGK